MKFKQCNRNQGLFLPPNYETFLGESHQAIVLAEFIDNLDLSSLESGYGNEHGGRSAYHPVMLLTILIYGYMNGVFSSRKIAACLRQDLAYMYLAGNNTPDFRTLARFRKEKGVHLQTAFKEVVNKARELGFVAFGTVSLDGTKIYANANKQKNETRDALETKIRDLIEQAEQIDNKEDAMYADQPDEEPNELKTKEGRAKKKEELQKKREHTASRLEKLTRVNTASFQRVKKINTTDPDARLMKMKRGDFANGYNVQIMTENSMVLASYIAGNCADQPLLVPTVQVFQTMHGTKPNLLLADKGYASETNYRFCETEHIDAYIPVHKAPLDLTPYVYDSVRDTYTDILGCLYVFKQRVNRNRQERHPRGRPKKTEVTQSYTSTTYEHIDTLTKKKKYLSVARAWQRYALEQKKKLTSVHGKTIYQQRIRDVEPAFGNIKHNLHFTTFLLRGFAGVTNEWNLITIAHNIKKML